MTEKSEKMAEKIAEKKVRIRKKIVKRDNTDKLDETDTTDKLDETIMKKIEQGSGGPISFLEQEETRSRLQQLRSQQNEQHLREQQEFEQILEKIRLEDEELERNKKLRYQTGPQTTSEEWYLLSQLDPNILKDVIKTLYLETVKFENGIISRPTIELCISMALDLKKQEEQEEQKTKLKEQETKLEEKQEETYTKEDRLKMKEAFLQKVEQNLKV